ncbi:MAG: SIMPL domain-containing protein [Candidatus Uhrbacteria bacterium]|nr:SIMPL domain-containing protein [Candidatus Uhrbacteria bacterium]
MDSNKTGVIVGSFVLALGLIAASYIASSTVMQAKALQDATITMTGSAKATVHSDLVKWTGSFSRTVNIDQVKDGYTQMKTDQTNLEAFLTKNGMAATDYKISPVFMSQVYKQYDTSPIQYTLSQNLELSGTDLTKVEALPKHLQDLINLGILFSSNNLEYYYTKLPDQRVALLSDAVGDAKTRAEQIAKSSGLHVGAIRSASMGVVQVLPPNSTDVSDYGSYDTSSVDKDIMVTVKTVFNLEK